METGATVEEFITIVPVGESKPAIQDPAFVTVLTVGAANGAAEVVVRRPRGARLGLGLKFEGGSAAVEKVRRLLVQSCAEDSPAANASTPWGKLIPGDEILAIDGVSVSDLTRIECVRRLKDSDESLQLLVRHFETENNPDKKNMESKETADTKQNTELVRPSMLPPPVPPRKLGKKNSFKDKSILQTLGEQNALINIELGKELEKGKESIITQHAVSAINKLSRKSSFDSHIHRQNKESFAYLRKGSPEEVRRLVRRLSDGKAMPPDADFYINLLSNEWERCLVLADAESDDTGSSISTVVDRLGSMASSVESSIPSTPVMQPKSIDIQKVLNSIENIDTDILKDMTSGKFLEKRIDDIEQKKPEKKSLSSYVINNYDDTQDTLVSENTVPKSRKTDNNDKNNNLTLIMKHNTETNDSLKSNDKVHKEGIVEKPKPMPRNTKLERSASDKKRRPIPIPELLSQPPPEPLLTPTKKTCIETWLQRSEAEMNNKTDDKLEENIPEVLPRLIDFVPKMQFKENNTETTTTCVRPTTAPPPPPGEPREDGSGASLDTIGELDESCDVIDNAKPIENESSKRKSLYERNFWDDRLSKSDAEDKSLSNDETPMPSCPRQPPDGVETPSDAVEKIPELPTKLPPRLSAAWPTNTRTRLSYLSRTQDARSEASVKDKIAMFSVETVSSSDRLDKCGTLPVRSHSTLRKNPNIYTSNYSEVSSLDRRLTKSQDNLDETPRSFKRNSDRPEVLGALETTTIETKNKRFTQSEINNKPLFYGSTTTLPSDTSFTRPTYHVRSISDDNSNKSIPTHKSNLEYLIEQRKKSMSKLRGLVIPEVQAPIVDLPEIKVQDSISKNFLQNSSNKEIKKDNKMSDAKSYHLTENKWKTNFLPHNIPKYSPAFKRKSLQVYTPTLSKESTPERKFIEKIDTLSRFNSFNNPVTAKPLKHSLEFSKVAITKSSPVFNRDTNKSNSNTIAHDFKNVEIKICTATDIVDSDNDSAMSSTQSSYRSSASSPMHNMDNNIESDNSRLSPKITQYNSYSLSKIDIPNKTAITEKSGEQYIKRNVCRSISSDTNISLSSSAGSAATSGSQASCSSLESSVADSDKRKVSKIYNVDTINRRNIVASAKCRSGRDVTLESPVVETKFSRESYNRSPSPIHKTSDRLSTLTPAVSALAAKGENRRRNKIIVDTDSDSDNEVNIRQRKPDYKNTRLKRNPSASNKNKNNENNDETEKNDDISKVNKKEMMEDSSSIQLNLDNWDGEKNATLKKKSNLAEYRTMKENNSKEKQKEKCNGITLKGNKNELVNILSNSVQSMPVNSYSNKDTKKSTINLKTDVGKQQNSQNSSEIFRLKKGIGSGVGLILAGGIDCEAKDVTVHRVLEDGVAAKAGIKRGSKIRSINGHTMSGLTHAQSVSVLKEKRSEVIIEVENENRTKRSSTECGSENAESKGKLSHLKYTKENPKSDSSVVTVMLEKAGGGAGLGFGLDGGRDSPQGDRPLTIKKLFAGGAAAQSGRIVVGAELLSAGGQSMEGFTRTQAWAALKALPSGQVALVLKNPESH